MTKLQDQNVCLFIFVLIISCFLKYAYMLALRTSLLALISNHPKLNYLILDCIWIYIYVRSASYNRLFLC